MALPTLTEALTMLAEWQAAGRPTHPTTRTEAGLRDRPATQEPRNGAEDHPSR